jgi:hypothetical protein
VDAQAGRPGGAQAAAVLSKEGYRMFMGFGHRYGLSRVDKNQVTCQLITVVLSNLWILSSENCPIGCTNDPFLLASAGWAV